jgi:hypothetical protein
VGFGLIGIINQIPKLNPDKLLQAYIIGVALGDGDLSNPNGRAVRLRITCDKKYPRLIEHVAKTKFRSRTGRGPWMFVFTQTTSRSFWAIHGISAQKINRTLASPIG